MVVDLYTYRITIGDGDGRSRGKKWKHFLPSVIALVSGLDIQNYAGAAY